MVPIESPDLAAEEIERCAADRRFVQVLLLAMNEAPLGRRHYWPIFRAAERFGLPVGIHAGTGYRHAPTGRSEEHTSELQSLIRTSYAVFCLKQKKKKP